MSDDKRISVYTPLGKGVIIAEFCDGTVCVQLDATGGGVILLREEIFSPRIPAASAYSARLVA